jgi:glycosyltransferase involved in cell wall biosynthesis
MFAYQNYGGISRYFYELMCNINKYKLADFYLSTKYSNNYYLRTSDFLNPESFLEGYNFRGKVRLLSLVNHIHCIKDLKHVRYDVLHPTYYNPYFLKHLKGKSFVLTIHDMIHEIYPEYFGKNNRTREYKKILAEKAAKIIAISENTKNDIIRILGVDESKIVIIPHGCSLMETFDEKMKVDIPERYLLYVGDRANYKNFNGFLSSVHKTLKDDDSLFLVCAGGRPFNAEEIDLIERLKVKEKVLKYTADNKTLAYLYSKALAFVFPSLYEGFGIPILESMQCGCPAILSNTSSLTEVGGDAAVYFDPLDGLSMKSSIEKVIYNESLRSELRAKGYNNISRFSWEKTARDTVKVYESCI